MLFFKKIKTEYGSRLFALTIFVLSLPLSMVAQKKKQDNPYRASQMGDEAMAIHLSGFAPLGYLGGNLGVDVPLKIIEKRGFKGFLAGRNFIEWYLTPEVGIRHNINNYEDFSASIALTYRRVEGQNGWFWQVSPIGAGADYLMPPFGTDAASPSSGISAHPLLARKWYVTPSVSVGLGRDFALHKGRRSGLPLVIYGKIGLRSLLPYKTYGYLVPTAELGIGYRFPSLAIPTRQVRRS